MARNKLADTPILRPVPKRTRAEQIDIACDALRLGAPMILAADLAGITEETIHAWMRAGDHISECLRAARAESYMAHIVKATQGTSGPQGSQFYLERRYRADWGKEPAVTIDNRTQNVNLDLSALGDDELEQLHTLLRRAIPAPQHGIIPVTPETA